MGATLANNNKDAGDDNDDLPATVLAPLLTITIPPLNLVALSLAHDSHQATPVKKTSIPLKILFKYPAATDLPLDESGMNSFWQGGIQNLENKLEAYELLSLSEENADVINPKIPTMHQKLILVHCIIFNSVATCIGQIPGCDKMPDVEIFHKPLTHHDSSMLSRHIST